MALVLTGSRCPTAPLAVPLARTPAGGDRPARRRDRRSARGDRRLRAAEAPRRRPQPERDLQAAEAAEAEKGEDGQLADVRAQPGPHPLPAGARDQAPLPQDSGATPSGRCSSSRRSTSAARSTAVNNSGFAFALDADTGKVALGTADRPPQRLLADLLPPSPLHRQPGPRPHRQARREDRQDHLEKDRCRAGPSPRRWWSAAASTSAAKTASCSRSAPSTATCAGRPRSAARSSRRPPTTAAGSTSATTAAT